MEINRYAYSFSPPLPFKEAQAAWIVERKQAVSNPTVGNHRVTHAPIVGTTNATYSSAVKSGLQPMAIPDKNLIEHLVASNIFLTELLTHLLSNAPKSDFNTNIHFHLVEQTKQLKQLSEKHKLNTRPHNINWANLVPEDFSQQEA